MQEHPLLLLAAGNLSLEALHKWTEVFQPIFSSMVSLGQIAVAVATVIYIIRKTKLLGKQNEKDSSIDPKP